jgi:hypothetical protein
MTNRISGDFNLDAVEAFRAAYAAQLSTPDEDGIANNSGLPTNIVSNTSPWIEHTGLWKYPSGKGPDQDLKTPFNPSEYLSGEIVDGDEDSESLMSDEQLDSMVDELLELDEDEE